MRNFGSFYNQFIKENKLDVKFQNLKVLYINNPKDSIWMHKIWIYYYSILDELYCSRDFLVISQYDLSCNVFNIKALDKNRDDLKIEHRGFKIYDEMLKTSFLKSMNIYDKIAVLLNHFEDLNMLERYVFFYGKNSIFKKSKILNKNPNNKYLLELNEMQKKFDTKTDLFKMKNYRNKLTHNYFVIHNDCNINTIKHPYAKSRNLVTRQNKFSHIIYNDLLKYTIKSLKLNIKAIAITLDFINNKKRIDIKNFNQNKVFVAKCGDNLD